jgi:hypothetical protein
MASAGQDEPTTLPVLMYHSISRLDGGRLRPLAVPPDRLAEQLAALATRHRPTRHRGVTRRTLPSC